MFIASIWNRYLCQNVYYKDTRVVRDKAYIIKFFILSFESLQQKRSCPKKIWFELIVTILWSFFDFSFIWYTSPADQESEGSLYDVDAVAPVVI